ncbi:MAG TPA: AAA family ATPase [Acetobacteraceae bacterium]|nr:AAA family ATPase [Acetobacteraceae bacterium]
MPPPSLERPRLWIVAGPNGSGKSTLYDRSDIEGFGCSVWIIDPDLLTRQIQAHEGRPLLLANLEALRRIEAWLLTSIRSYRTIGVETVLSTPKYRPMVQQAKMLGFEIRLLYVLLRTADMNVDRVRLRVRGGGHDVAEDRIRARRERSLLQLPWFLDHADLALIYDNSGARPLLVGSKQDDVLVLDPAAPPAIRQALETAGCGDA